MDDEDDFGCSLKVAEKEAFESLSGKTDQKYSVDKVAIAVFRKNCLKLAAKVCVWNNQLLGRGSFGAALRGLIILQLLHS